MGKISVLSPGETLLNFVSDLSASPVDIRLIVKICDMKLTEYLL